MVVRLCYIHTMSYNLTLQCCCIVYVSTHPGTRIAPGLPLFLLELLPDPLHRPHPSWSDVLEDIH